MKKSPAELQRERELLIEDELSQFLQQNTIHDDENFRPGKMSQTQFQELYGKLRQGKHESELKLEPQHCSKNNSESENANNDYPVTRRTVELSARQEELLYSFRKKLREEHKSPYPFNDEDIIRILIELIPELPIPKSAEIANCNTLEQILKSVMNTETEG